MQKFGGMQRQTTRALSGPVNGVVGHLHFNPDRAQRRADLVYRPAHHVAYALTTFILHRDKPANKFAYPLHAKACPQK